jgi:WD40 repeat protein
LFLLGDAGAGRGALVWSDGSFRSTWPGSSARNNDVNGTQAPGEAVAARLSADGREVILVNQDGDIQIRESGDGVILRKIPGISREIIPVSGGELQNRAAISMDAATVAFVLPDGAVRVTSVPSGEHHDLPGPPARVISYTADQLLIERLDGTLDEWDTLGTRLIRSIPGDAAYAEGITGIPHSSLVARLTYQGTVELTDLDSGQTLGSVTAPLPARSGGEPPWDSTTISATPDGSELVTASSCGSIIRWQLDPRAWIRDACTLAGHDLTAEEWRQYVGTNPPANLACLG